MIAVDMATADQPLWISSLLTIGSQAPLFHVCDPRGGRLRPYQPDQLVQLPASLARWPNLWEPLDVLAFIAAGVFRLPDQSSPHDVAVPHLTSSGLWTHSAYWKSTDLPEQIRSTMTRGRRGVPSG
ncbi:hypothetical protein [Kitasatospora sp. GP82]|uniref:hypothetical protein n=1 Tax=Kitasatospora sp. GP82 TaxID=3035089 RepID=UPI002475B3E6|nr:hypothetical protein [Kitasatospora sp. GP82]